MSQHFKRDVGVRGREMAPIHHLGAEGALKAAAQLFNPTGAPLLLRSDISKLSRGALPAFLSGLSDSLFSEAAFEIPVLGTLPCPRCVWGAHQKGKVDGPQLLAGTETSKMDMVGWRSCFE